MQPRPMQILMGFAILMGANVLAQDDLPKIRKITPNSIRIEPLTKDATGGWITLGEFSEIGSPAISPDSETVAFDGHEKGYGNSPGEIWIARRDGSKLHKLVAGVTPRWSPDGSKILFTRKDTQGVSQVRVINADGTGEKQLCEGSWPDWSPDGKLIVFSRDGKPGGGAKVLSRIYLAKSDGTEPKALAAGDCPSWSPDGKRIACCYRDPAMPAPAIRIVDLTNGREHFAGYGWYRPNWSSDSQFVVANSTVAPRQTWIVEFNAIVKTAPKPIHTDFERPFSPDRSRDGKYSVFVARKPE